jgi:branched-chain amino acid transport system substrate-binding protein
MRHLIGAASLTALMTFGGVASAQVPNNKVKIGVLSDFSGPFSDQAGKGSFIAAQMAAEDFARESKGLKAEIIFADHQNKPDVGASIARRWIDQEEVVAIVDLPNSGVALAVNTIMKEKNRTMLASGAATSDLTGKFCQPTTVQWALDTWALGNAMGRAITERGGKSWYFVSFDYALGKALQRDTTEAVQKQGGKILGSVSHPLGTADFSSYLLQAQASGADVIALGDTGADAINAIKQVSEFNILSGGKKLAALFMQIVDIDALGLKAAQGLLLSEAFYWDLNDSTRAWSARFAQRMEGRVPTINHAATYSATIAYLRAVQTAQTIEGDKVIAQLQTAEIDDPLFGPIKVRKDGRAIHTMFVFEVKPPQESKQRYDYYKLVRTIPAEEAFRPIDQGECPLVK